MSVYIKKLEGKLDKSLCRQSRKNINVHLVLFSDSFLLFFSSLAAKTTELGKRKGSSRPRAASSRK